MKKVKLVFKEEEGKSLVLIFMSSVKKKSSSETEEIFLILCLMGKSVHITQGHFIAPLVKDEEFKML